jgi:hypothetical protein
MTGGGVIRHRARVLRFFGLARTAEFIEADQIDHPRPVLLQKIFRFAPTPNQIYIVGYPAPTEGRFAIVTDVRRDAVDAAALLTNGTKADGEVVWS